jgi:RNA polymerase sigma-70 factor (ECF subfamily)
MEWSADDMLAKAQRGDARAQEAFLRGVAAPVRALVRRCGRAHEEEDQLQEVFARLLEVLPRFRPEGPAKLTTWVHTVVHRWLISQHRRRAVAVEPLDEGLAVPDTRPSAHELVERRQLSDQLEAALGHLSDEQRRVFVLTQLHHQSLEEVAKTEGVALGTVKSRLHRARAELVLRLGEALDAQTEKGGPRGQRNPHHG